MHRCADGLLVLRRLMLIYFWPDWNQFARQCRYAVTLCCTWDSANESIRRVWAGAFSMRISICVFCFVLFSCFFAVPVKRISSINWVQCSGLLCVCWHTTSRWPFRHCSPSFRRVINILITDLNHAYLMCCGCWASKRHLSITEWVP